MATKNTYQTANQYHKRKKRISKKNDYDTKKNILANDIVDLKNQIENLNQKLNEKIEERNRVEERELSDLMNVYNDKELLDEIINLAKETTFSASNIEDMKNKCNKGINEDNITLEDIEKLSQMDQRINQEIKHTNSISDFISTFGEKIDISNGKKEENTNGN